MKEAERRQLLFPFYCDWCNKHDVKPISHNTFTKSLIDLTPFPTRKVRKLNGIYIKGIQLKPEVLNRDNRFGGEIAETKLLNGLNVDKPDTVHIYQDLYTQYFNILGKTPFKFKINKLIRTNLPTLEEVMVNYFSPLKNPSKEYQDLIKGVIEKGLDTVRNFGAIPYNYIFMGTSPRVVPKNYGQTINNTKKVLRESLYQKMADLAPKYSIVDFDLKSCYTSILLGLYPKSLESLQYAIEKVGLWKYVQSEFDKKGVGEHFNKPAVKICVYSSFFLGGSKAMIEGIEESVRKDLGLTKPEFRKHELYFETQAQAQKISNIMQDSDIISDFRSIADYIKRENLDRYLIGPTGHKYKVTEKNFRYQYPNWLQSYEFALLANATLRVKKKFPSVEVISHLHDGNTLAIPNHIVEEVISFYDLEVKRLGAEYGLSYPQTIEVKEVFTCSQNDNSGSSGKDYFDSSEENSSSERRK